MLKKAKSKSKLPEAKVGQKKRLDATLADETSKYGLCIYKKFHFEKKINRINPWSAKPDICGFRRVGSLYCFPRSP